MAKRQEAKNLYFPCPQCGAPVRRGALACPKCGSDNETGWSVDADKWNADIPAGYGDDEDFDYNEFVAEEFPQHANRSSAKRVWSVLVVLAVLAVVLSLLLS